MYKKVYTKLTFPTLLTTIEYSMMIEAALGISRSDACGACYPPKF